MRRVWNRFWLDCAHAVDNLTVGICRATGQPTPIGVVRRARRRREALGA